MESTMGKRQGRSERNDAIVTARVPAEIKKQGNAVLREIGSTPTELVNAAYRYVLKRGGTAGTVTRRSNHVSSGSPTRKNGSYASGVKR